MIWVPGTTYMMGSDSHYAEEAPAHPVTVDGFWIDQAPVTNRQFLTFVNSTGHTTFAEKKPLAEDYPGAAPANLRAGSLVFTPPAQAVQSRDLSQWWVYASLQLFAG
jgi:formylglycine-generating enzyme required for sulfatase activity